nr:phosphate ABC transporter permease subunit PstC [Nevskia sp.]
MTMAGSSGISLSTLRQHNFWDAVMRHATRTAALTVLLVLGGVIYTLVVGSLPALNQLGLGFFSSQRWNPVEENLGGLTAIYGTLITALIALVIAVPISLGIAIFITELCPRWLRRPIGIAIELLAGIPSIIYGIWGLFVFAPVFRDWFQIPVNNAVDGIPILSTVFGGQINGYGILTAGIILSIMILPYITSITRDVFETVPAVLKESAYGLGSTTWEVVRKVVLPYSGAGVIGGIMLGLGRALGETMAVTFVVGNSHRLTGSLFSPGTTISASIANEFAEAENVMHESALTLLGLTLFVITFIVLAAARLMLLRLEQRKGN